MVAYVFDDILVKGIRTGQVPGRTVDARNWFRDKAKSKSVAPTSLISRNRAKQVRSVEDGSMYLFNYDPKFKKKLPYYDRFPLIFMIGGTQSGFTGVNLHYLPLVLRAKLMDALYSLVSDNRYDEGTKLRISYDILKSTAKYKEFKPCIKKYLGNHVRSSFLKIDPVEWDIALFLPLQRFEKASTSTVYADSRRMIA